MADGPIPVDCLLPSGILVSMPCNARSSLDYIKSQLFDEARNYPLFNLLQDKSCYVFVGVNEDAQREELVDEMRTLDEVRLFQPLLKVVEKKGNQEEKRLNAEISQTIGKRLADFANLGTEVYDFRKSMLQVCRAAVEDRQRSWRERLVHAFPANVEERQLPPNLASNLPSNGKLHLEVNVPAFGAATAHVTTVQVEVDSLPSQAVEAVFSRKSTHIEGQPQDYLLRVCGREEYLIKDCPLSYYKYIRQCIAKATRPELVLHRCKEMLDSLGQDPVLAAFQGNEGAPAPALPARGNSLWQLPPSEKLKIKVVGAKNVTAGELYKLQVKAGVYHGDDSLSCIGNTRVSDQKTVAPAWNEFMVFETALRDLPRNARLCFVIYGVIDASSKGHSRSIFKRKQDHVPIAWVNMNIFDYRGQLQTGTTTLYCWHVDGSLDESLNYIGTTVMNPNTSGCISLEVDIVLGVTIRSSIVYPSIEDLHMRGKEMNDSSRMIELSATEYEQMRHIIELDKLAELAEQDRGLIWKARAYCRDMPHSLPKLVSSAKWDSRDDIAEMYFLVKNWPLIEPEKAMELLDYQYADQIVRKYAVECLEAHLQDSDLQQYLLQLVQVLKYESYLDCPLATFLLKRALLNKNIGHYFFWHLRAEMDMPEVAVRFGLMLEAYCRGNVLHMRALGMQIKALGRYEQICKMLQSKQLRDRSKKQHAVKVMRDMLDEPGSKSLVSEILSPLDPAFRLGTTNIEKCKFMDSKMRPLWLVYKNHDSETRMNKDLYLIFKNGDDLRQDMLTLQMISIMDTIWQQSGLDFRLIPYGCLSTGVQVGLIEVVLESQTVANIQKTVGGSARAAFNKKCLYQFLQNWNPDKTSLDKAVETFTYSCAGYCVATYTLGIGDRHSDNIMLKKNGQLFHIDFGHFLGNFKSKFGVKRERVPFVLTHDFIYVISKGGSENSNEFAFFKDLCEKAFIELRRHGNFIISLFAMMLQTGIPELRSLDDIRYVQEALHLGYSEEEALEKFRKKFKEAIDNSWSVSWNWWVHNMAKNNPG